MGKNSEKTLLLRMPAKIHKAVKSRAEKNKRSLNSQIIFELDTQGAIVLSGKEVFERMNRIEKELV